MTLEKCLLLAGLLFAIGVYGVLTRRNLIGVLMSIELMFNAANINFISFAYFKAADGVAGSMFVLFIIAISACEMAIALAIVISIYRRNKNLDVYGLERLYG